MAVAPPGRHGCPGITRSDTFYDQAMGLAETADSADGSYTAT